MVYTVSAGLPDFPLTGELGGECRSMVRFSAPRGERGRGVREAVLSAANLPFSRRRRSKAAADRANGLEALIIVVLVKTVPLDFVEIGVVGPELLAVLLDDFGVMGIEESTELSCGVAVLGEECRSPEIWTFMDPAPALIAVPSVVSGRLGLSLVVMVPVEVYAGFSDNPCLDWLSTETGLTSDKSEACTAAST